MPVQIAWGAKVSPEFLEKVLTIGVGFGWTYEQASFLMSCMAWETGETFSASVQNGAGSGATGLIQFMPNTAKALGTTTQALARMTPVQQLDYVKKYFQPYASQCKTLADTYLAILMPSFIGKPDNITVFASPRIAYKQNKGFDFNKDGVITKAEVVAKVEAKHKKGLSNGYAKTLDT